MAKILSAFVLLFLAGQALADMDIEITINWVAPTENVDGTPLTDLAGFNVYHGSTTGNYGSFYYIDSAVQTSDVFTVFNVNSGESVFVVMTALDDDGNESVYSNEVSFGPFVENDTTAPGIPGGVTGSARIIRCGLDTCSGGT